MILELLLRSHGYVAVGAHLLTVLDLSHSCEVLLPVKVGLLCLCGVEEDVTEIALELVLLAAFGVLLLGLASYGDVARGSKQRDPLLTSVRDAEGACVPWRPMTETVREEESVAACAEEEGRRE